MKLAATLVVTLVLAATAHADGPKPAERAAKLVAAQIAGYNDGNKTAVAATFGDAVVITETDNIASGEQLESALDTTGGAMAPTPFNGIGSAKKKKLVVGGNDSAVWVHLELTLKGVTSSEGQGAATRYTRPLRISELVVDDGGTQKVVAAMISMPGLGRDTDRDPLTEIPSPTDAGPLAALLTSPAALDAALAKDASVVVWGTEPSEVGVGQAGGRKLLKKWKKLSMELDGKVREVTTKTWGFVLANVNLKVKGEEYPMRMRALLIAVPNAAGGWSVVSVNFSNATS